MRRSLILVLTGAVALTVGCVKQESAPPAPVAAVPAEAPAPPAPLAAASDSPASPAPSRPVPPPPPKASVADFPDYPGAVRVAYSERTDAGKEFPHRTDAEWTSADAYTAVVEYYQKAIVDMGWTITGTKTKKTEVEWQLTKGTSEGTVKIEDDAPVTIKIERKDR